MDAVGQIAVATAYAGFAVVSIALAAIDARTHRLPNGIVASGYAIATAAFVVAAIAGAGPGPLTRALVAAAVLFALFLAVRIVDRRAVGGGDVKLAGLLGLHLGWLGWDAVFLGPAIAFAAAGAFALVLIATRRAAGETRIAFGPWLLLGAWTAIAAAVVAPGIG